MTDEWLTTRQAAEYLNLHRSRVQQLAAAGALRCWKPGSELLFSRQVLREYRATLPARNAARRGKRGRPFRA